MDWIRFAKTINAKFQDNSSGIVIGDIIQKKIIREEESERIEIEKKIRRSYGSSSHFNLEKLELNYSKREIHFGRTRIVKKTFLKRLGNKAENQYKIEGDKSELITKIILTKELQFLLDHPKSEFILIGNTIKFKTESLGEMSEELSKMYNSIMILKDILTR